MQTGSRWKLTGWQWFAVVIAVTLAVFVGAMSWGMGQPLLVLVAVALVAATGLGIFLVGLSYRAHPAIVIQARVVRAQRPPADKIVGSCRMELRLEVDGTSTVVRHRDPSVSVIKWPWPGTILPLVVSTRNLRKVRVLWESVPPRHLRQSTSEQTAATEPPAELEVSFYTDYADSASAAGPPAEPAGATAGPPAEPAGTVDGPAGPPMVEPEPESVSGPPRRGVGAEPTRDGPMVAPGLVVDGEVVTSDHSDNGVRPAGSFEPLALPSGGVPRPRPPGSPLRPPRIGIMVPVSNLARSLRLYRDQLGFTVVEVDADSAVLAHGTGRIVLRRVPRLTPASRPQVLLHVEVSDVDQVYEEMRAKGVEFLHPPQLMNPGQQVQLWAATFLDPDQHTIALSQWRGPD